MTPDQVAAIADQLHELREDVRELRADVSRRLTSLELWRARWEGAQAAVGKVPVLLACGGSAVAIVLGLVALI